MKKIIIANWKMNPATPLEAEKLYHFSCDACLGSGENAEVIVCPPFVYLDTFSKIESSLKIGAQNCHWESGGAFTGEISAVMLKNLGVKYVIVGHSERRWIMNESDEMINKKLKAALANNLTPIFALGERIKGEDRKNILENQLKHGLVGLDSNKVGRIIFAYEPVWAIGTGNSETAEHAVEAIKIIKGFLDLNFNTQGSKLLYGGSVDSGNIKSFLERPEIDGALVGGASIKKEEFKKMIEIASGL